MSNLETAITDFVVGYFTDRDMDIFGQCVGTALAYIREGKEAEGEDLLLSNIITAKCIAMDIDDDELFATASGLERAIAYRDMEES